MQVTFRRVQSEIFEKRPDLTGPTDREICGCCQDVHEDHAGDRCMFASTLFLATGTYLLEPYDSDISKILSDNSMKAIQEQEDQLFMETIDEAIR